ncbi:MAG TPA: lipid-A-disaccharide synthase [Candidatus Avimuribaculum pullicola]|nr:lipid-A-disaccharide synthase [Candidatus Avimuribaculum pullicola]
MRYFLIAGEASGDLHAAQLIKGIKANDSSAEFAFFGGDLMAAAAGCAPLVHYREMAFMGFIEVLKHIGQIAGFLRLAKRQIDQWQPHAVVLVDYPSFNLKVAKYAHSRGILPFYFISPKVWAWKEYRVKQIKRYITELYSILPFETEFYARHGYKVEYVGNPTVKEMADVRKTFVTEEQFKLDNGLDASRPIIALLPGSRHKEIRDNLPEMVAACREFPDFQIVIGGAPSIDKTEYHEVLKRAGIEGSDSIKVLFGQSHQLAAHSRAAVVTSGTATLETAVLGTPQVVCYRMNGSKRVYNLYKHLLKVKYVSLPNLIADEPILTELLLHYCNRRSIADTLSPLLGDTPQRRAMLAGYSRMMARLGTADCAATAAAKLVARLNN